MSVTMFLRFLFISLLFWSQCSSHFIRQIDTEENSESDVEELRFVTKPKTEDGLDTLHFSMFGESHSFKLIPANSIFSPSFQIIQDTDFFNLENSEPLEGSFYTDENGRASFYIHHANNQLQIQGFIDDAVTIRNTNGRHVAHKLSNKQIDYDSDIENFTPTIANRSSTKTKIHKSSNEVTVEILVLMDNIVKARLEEHDTDVKKYLGVYYNYVENKYRIFQKPKVKFSLSGLLFYKNDVKWIKDSEPVAGKVVTETLLKNLGQYMYQVDQKVPNYDITLLHTGLDIVSQDKKTGALNSNVLGVAYTSCVCLEQGNQIYSLTLVEDTYAPLYGGSLTAAHEIGHSLGSGHDNDVSEACKDDKTGLMQAITQLVSASLVHFTPCSVQQITKILDDTEKSSCLWDTPAPTEIPIIPEQVSRDQICKLRFGQDYFAAELNLYAFNKLDVCALVLCRSTKTSKIQYYAWLPEGESCGDDKICIKGKCTSE